VKRLLLGKLADESERRSNIIDSQIVLALNFFKGHAAGEAAEDALDNRRQPDTGISALWRRFIDCEEEQWRGDVPPTLALTAADFPAWLLLREPGLNLQLAVDLAVGNTPAEETYRSVHRWIDARRANRSADELALRKTLQADHPVLFRYLKRSV
jgi:hypothetical protein